MIFERTIQFEPVSLKRHRHRLKGGTYDPSKKEKDEFIKAIVDFPEEILLTKPIKCVLHFYCKRPKNHYKTGKLSHMLKDNAPQYNTNNKDLDNMVKFVLDALNAKLYTDDSLIYEISCSKMYSTCNNGYIYVSFEEANI